MATNTIKEKLKNLKLQDEIIVETEIALLAGQLQYIDINRDFLTLTAVRDLRHNALYTSRQFIPTKMIKCVKKIAVDECSFESATENTKSYSSEETTSTTEQPRETTKDRADRLPEVILSAFEVELLQKQIMGVKVLNCRGTEYNAALEDIKSRNCIALDVLPHQSGRNRKTSIITIATENSTYIFDILMLGKLFEDLKAILRADRPYKAMHNSDLLADHLQHRHSLQINCISDTFVAYCFITKCEQKAELEDVVEHYFGITKDYFKQNESHSFFNRPLKENLISYCVKRAVFIFKLNECFHRFMLRKYYSQCWTFSRIYADNEDAPEVATSIERKDNLGHKYIQELDLSDQS